MEDITTPQEVYTPMAEAVRNCYYMNQTFSNYDSFGNLDNAALESETNSLYPELNYIVLNQTEECEQMIFVSPKTNSFYIESAYYTKER